MKAFFEMFAVDANDIITASGNTCIEYSGGSETCCEGDDNC